MLCIVAQYYTVQFTKIHSYLKLTSQGGCFMKYSRTMLQFLKRSRAKCISYIKGWIFQWELGRGTNNRKTLSTKGGSWGGVARWCTLLCDALFNLNYYRVDKKLNTFLCNATSNKPTILPILCSTVQCVTDEKELRLYSRECSVCHRQTVSQTVQEVHLCFS